MKQFVKKNWNYIIAFLIPWIIVVIHSLLRSSWPFGVGSILAGDTGIQIYPMMLELWDKVHSGESLFFSWNAGCGIDFYCQFLYYLFSPLNIIILLFPRSLVDDTLQFVMILKLSLMAINVSYYFLHTGNNKLKEHKKLIALVLSCAFILSDYTISLFSYVNWMDVVVLFPLILLELERLIEKGEWKRYYIFLSLAMLCSFYFAFQVCIFLVFWFVLNILSKPLKFKRFLQFAGVSLLSALTSSVVILPALFGVSNRNTGSSLPTWINTIYSFGEHMFIFSEGTVDWMSRIPNLYFSIVLLVLFGLFFVVKNDRKIKIGISVVWVILLLSLFVGELNKVWHGFAAPFGVHNRFLYLFIFLMLYMANEALAYLEGIKKWQWALVALIEIGYFIVCFINIKNYNSVVGYLLTFLLLVLINLVLFFFLKGSIKYKNLLVALSVFALIELFSNAVYEFKEYDIWAWDEITNHTDADDIREYIKLEDGQRANFTSLEENMGLVLDCPSTNQFTSYNNSSIIQFFNRMGFEYMSSSNKLIGSAPLGNFMFNVRYGISTSDKDFTDGTMVQNVNDLKLYEIDRIGGLGYMVSSNIKNFDVDKYSSFELQNDFIEKSVDGEPIFTPVLPKEKFTDGILLYKKNEEAYKKGYYYYDYTSKNVKGMELTEFSFIADEDMDLYLNAFCEAPTTCVIYVDDEEIYRDRDKYYQNLYHIGNVKKGQSIIIYSVHDLDVGQEANLWFRFAKYNEENYAKAYEKLSDSVLELDSFKASSISGTIDAKEQGIMMTSIPAMKGFTVYVDGKETKTEVIGKAFIGVPLEKGKHKVTFKYRTPYFATGLSISLGALIVFILICLLTGKKSEKEVDSKLENEKNEVA